MLTIGGSGACSSREYFDSRLSEVVSDAISGVKEQELLQIGNLAIVLASHSRWTYTLVGVVPQL